jgi:hypothetical protein
MTHVSVAARDIALGEELSISYIDGNYLHQERSDILYNWGFNCSCAQCTMNKAKIAASDARLRKIQVLKHDLERVNSTTVTPETGAQLVRLHHEERLDIYMGHAYTRAALNFALFAKEEKAIEYAQKAVEALEREFGPEAGDIPGMRSLVTNPRQHWAWGLRLKRHGKKPNP